MLLQLIIPFDLPSNQAYSFFSSSLDILFDFLVRFRFDVLHGFFFFAFCWSWTVLVLTPFLFFCSFSLLFDGFTQQFRSSRDFFSLARFKEAPTCSATRLPSCLVLPASAKSCSRWRALESRSFFFFFLAVYSGRTEPRRRRCRIPSSFLGNPRRRFHRPSSSRYCTSSPPLSSSTISSSFSSSSPASSSSLFSPIFRIFTFFSCSFAFLFSSNPIFPSVFAALRDVRFSPHPSAVAPR